VVSAAHFGLPAGGILTAVRDMAAIWVSETSTPNRIRPKNWAEFSLDASPNPPADAAGGCVFYGCSPKRASWTEPLRASGLQLQSLSLASLSEAARRVIVCAIRRRQIGERSEVDDSLRAYAGTDHMRILGARAEGRQPRAV